MKRIFWFLIFTIFIVILGFAFWYYQTLRFSREVVRLEILGPDTAKLAEPIEYLVRINNNGNINLEETKLIFEYPRYSLPLEGERLREEMNLGVIYPGQEKTISFKARLFGSEGERKVARVWLRYRPKNLRGFFESETSRTTILDSAPLVFSFDIPTRIESGQKIRFSLNYFSNADYPFSDIRILVDYPYNFESLEVNPLPLEENEWRVGLLNRGEGGRIEVSGKFFGEVGEKKTLRARLGMWRGQDFILLKETVRGVEIVALRLLLSQQINDNPEYIASPGDILHYQIFFRNLGQESLNDLFLVANLEGKAFDFQTLKSEQGRFQKGDNSIIFDSRTVPKLRFLSPQEEGKVEFWIELKEDWEILSPEDKNATIRNTVSIAQTREEFVTKINSELKIVSKAYFADEVFGNLGPIPPRVGETTTYTVMWQAKNYYNDMENVKIKATLPQNVRLTGEIFPEEATLTFDSQSREIVWDIGALKAGQGVITDAPHIAFQVALTPSEEQKGRAVPLISEVRITGEDTWTKLELEATAPAIDTTLPDDESIPDEQGVVE